MTKLILFFSNPTFPPKTVDLFYLVVVLHVVDAVVAEVVSLHHDHVEGQPIEVGVAGAEARAHADAVDEESGLKMHDLS